ncbi:hypothetical protein O181_041093 [Austropuccinia psidii MF-1]|uniref:Reverse transcriptase/retrotransposon-derived protein RNase H-like domain-containing protein n=1 Tax=Austropuccinia psidii MF-1 TaxID=1389203 RepID=A0A9Q3DGQ7_9BASI|nr:hypothetical protein [Austropuccinia psidii MF-1]
MVFEMIQAYDKIKYALTNGPLLLMSDWKLPFKLYIAAFGEGLGAALDQIPIVNDNAYEVPVCFISREIKPTEASYGESQMECLCLVLIWKPYIIVFMVVHMLRWKIAIQEYRCNMTIVHKAGNIERNADGLNRWALPNTSDNPAFFPTNAEPRIPTEGIKITDVGT